MSLIVQGLSSNEALETISEHHIHSHRLWMATAAAPNGEIHVADRFSPTAQTPFTLDAGNDTWGAWVQILGSSDTPIIAGNIYYDSNLLFVTATERTQPYLIQFGHGASGAAALTANEISEVVYEKFSAASEARSIEVQTDRHLSAVKLWARCFVPGQNTGTISFYMGIHEYTI